MKWQVTYIDHNKHQTQVSFESRSQDGAQRKAKQGAPATTFEIRLFAEPDLSKPVAIYDRKETSNAFTLRK